MFEISVTINIPGLLDAANIVAAAVNGIHKEVTNAPVATQAAVTSPPAPVAPPPVPLATAPAFTVEQLARAGADLYMRDPVKGQQAQALLAQFGVPAVTALPKERYGEFATALRGLGAAI